MAQDQKWPPGWAFDGRKNLFTVDQILDWNMEHNIHVGAVLMCWVGVLAVALCSGCSRVCGSLCLGCLPAALSCCWARQQLLLSRRSCAAC